MTLSKKILLFIFMSGILLSACNRKYILHEHKNIPENNWDYNYSVPFNFEIKDTSTSYNVYFHLRINADYLYSNIWIKCREIMPDQMTAEKMIDIKIANKEGVWLGKGLGDIYDYKVLVEENRKFNQAGTYRYNFKHELRVDLLEGVMDVGCSIEETGS